jgi:hypothetical protein
MFKKSIENIKWFWIRLLKRLDSIFKNGGTNWSSQRILSFLCVFIPILVWAIISIGTWSILVIPESVVILIIAGLTGKVSSKFVELKYNGEVNGESSNNQSKSN